MKQGVTVSVQAYPTEPYGARRGCRGRLAMILVIKGFLFYVVGFATHHWARTPYSTYGLWMLCDYCGLCESLTGQQESNYRRGSQATAVLALACGLTASITSLFYFFERFRGRKAICWVNVLLTTATILFLVITMCIMGIQVMVMAHISWSFYLCIAATIALTVGDILWLVQVQFSI